MSDNRPSGDQNDEIRRIIDELARLGNIDPKLAEKYVLLLITEFSSEEIDELGGL